MKIMVIRGTRAAQVSVCQKGEIPSRGGIRALYRDGAVYEGYVLN